MTTGSPWFRPANEPGPEPIPAEPYVPVEPHVPAEPYAQGDAYASGEPYAPAEQRYAPTGPYAPGPSYAPAEPYPPAEPYAYETPAPSYGTAAQESPYAAPYAPYEAEESPRPSPDETMVLEAVEPLPGPTPEPTPEPLPGPGRAERRRAAKGGRAKGRRGPATDSPDDRPAAPLSRVEARRAARAAKDSVGVVASRAVGELFITFGVVMLLFVTYQLWWTNVLAGQETDRAKEQIEDTWAKGDQGDSTAPDAFEPGQGFAIMYIPKLDVVVPVAEGISKSKVLDKGMVGHYGEGKLKTAMPADEQGNFAVAGHRNTHGEPFRYINQLKPGDPIVVETRSAYYTYEMASILPQTSPSNVSVIDPVPKQSGFDGPGRYITLTTCTPEFTSTYRMIVWGRLVEERPRSKGKPKALVG
ncbi:MULTISPECIES: class E sortase [unclassified Streptomyces]|uniref:class E sortase n=1 Tax=unclassified Streptomyces TaxID=2593676 RepID=UPI0006F9E11D|nr:MULTISPECIES: class E sortase [unclassified Streptomyces]KQX49497.1 peptidase C60 family protein [Streptomyces sp. Root1304]KRA79116.1 peptidase C60 family protein [Streptomyces sp. Root66D1]